MSSTLEALREGSASPIAEVRFRRVYNALNEGIAEINKYVHPNCQIELGGRDTYAPDDHFLLDILQPDNRRNRYESIWQIAISKTDDKVALREANGPGSENRRIHGRSCPEKVIGGNSVEEVVELLAKECGKRGCLAREYEKAPTPRVPAFSVPAGRVRDLCR